MKPSLLTRKLTDLGIFFGIDVSEPRLAMYVECLMPLPDSAIEQAIYNAKYQCRFFPSFAELLEFSGQKAVSPTEEAEQAWYAIRAWKKPLKDMPLEGPALEVVKKMGGRGVHPTAFGQWPTDREDFKRKEFIRLYAEMRAARMDETPQISHQAVRDSQNRVL